MDEANWAIKIGITDPKRIGIMGHSYGGYSSFYQAVTHPELYKVAMPQMGLWDWTDLGDELMQKEVVPASHLCVAPLPYTELAKVMSPSSLLTDSKRRFQLSIPAKTKPSIRRRILRP